MTDLTNFTDTSDVSDAAIEWVTSHGNCDYEKPTRVREYVGDGYAEDCAIIIAARLIQQHRPDLLVDPVDAIVREGMAQVYESNGAPIAARRTRSGEYDGNGDFLVAKRLYLMGIEKGKGA